MAKISVVIPTFNRAGLLAVAVRSVLAQVDCDLEIIISDNCSTDNTQEVAAQFLNDHRVRYHRHDENIGMVRNWEFAIERLATSDWFVLFSDDDYFTDCRYLADAAAAIDLHQPVFVYAGGVVHDIAVDTKMPLVLPFNGLTKGSDIFRSRGTIKPQDIILCNMVFRRRDVSRLGLFAEPRNLSCDSEFYLKLCSEGNAFAIPRPVCMYVRHGGNLLDKNRTVRDYLEFNLNFMVHPYVYAMASKMDGKAVAEFRKNVELDSGIVYVLCRLRLAHEQLFIECRARLRELVPFVMKEIEATPGYRAKSWFVLLLRPLRLRRYRLS